MAAPILTLDLFVHGRTDRAVRLSRDGDLRNSRWVALAHLDVAMAGASRAIVTIPRWLAEQEELMTPAADAGQAELFGGAA
ncbi:hypothetical protein [Kaistia nematophila]|uniref:Uncharacterized protein n=1 Tax=Kaistia nematophila TaxID=2994654 RepID=A0A9X3E6R5_9HYPH|nr:hypothetical protein [Kaistia nematophila]MCX5570598.1 hypothetical protein [Kaistia nematophila]